MGKSIRNFATVTRVGLDLAKRIFQVHAVDANGEIVVARKLGRAQLTPFFAALPPCTVAMEACASAHHWGRALMELGHEVRLLPPAHVKPYVRRNKSDQVDAAAIYEAMKSPWPAIRARAFDREPGRADAPSGARVARRPAYGGAQCFARPSGRDRPRRAAGRQHAYGLKRMAADGFNENCEIVVPDCARRAWSACRSDRRARRGDRSDRQRACSVGQGGRDGQAVDDHSRRRPGHRHGDRGHDPGCRRLRQRARVRRLPRPDATSELERRQNAARTDHQDGRSLSAQAPGCRRLRDASPSPRS